MPNKQPLNFLLTPDKSAARRVRRLIAEHGVAMGIVVGTWPELLSLARRCFVLPPEDSAWSTRLGEALAEIPGAFWRESLAVARDETTAAVAEALEMLLTGLGPDRSLDTLPRAGLPPRLLRRLNDLTRLHAAMGKVLPPDLATIRAILTADPARCLQSIDLLHCPDFPALDPWQAALVARLRADCPATSEPAPSRSAHIEILQQVAAETPAAVPGTALHALQTRLFTERADIPPVTLDQSQLQWLAVRDYLQEAEVAVGMIQTALQGDPTLSPVDFALLLPDDERYHAAVAEVFALAGVPQADPAGAGTVRDLSGEVVLNLLLSLNKPAPVMALASLLCSPLMPWGRAEGNRLAQDVINSRFELTIANEAAISAAMLDAILTPVADAASLRRRLLWFGSLLNREEALKVHAERAVALGKELAGALEGCGGEPPWHELMAKVAVKPLPAEEKAVLTREAVAVFQEGEEPWRTVKHLFVLGCSENHYPAPPRNSRTFSEDELEILVDRAGLVLETACARGCRLRRLFRRQLCSASAEITFLLPRRDPFGAALMPSTALTFASTLLKDVADGDALIVELATDDGLDRARGVPTAPLCQGEVRELPDYDALRFDKNLLELGRRPDGSLKPESPSRLEKLMVAPLAWLFERLGAEPRDWQPETLDVMAQGTLAHQVFEQLFAPGLPLPSPADIEEQAPRLFVSALQAIMPFLTRAEWRVEREHLQQGILKAALGWGEILRELGAEVLATEIPLQGRLDELPIHGNADLLLGLPGNRLLVVDYKKSSSGGRRTRMNERYDHQAELYRTMIKTGGLKAPDEAPAGLAEKLAVFRNAGEIGTLYYLMNDRIALADTVGWIVRKDARLEEVTGDASSLAIRLIRQRVVELSGGLVDLRLPESEKDLKNKRGLGVYALDSSPLMRMFVKEPSTP